MDSKVFYDTIRTGFDDVCVKIAKETGAPLPRLFIHVSEGQHGAPIIQLCSTYSSAVKIEVEGRDLNDVADEYIRRALFGRQQDTLSLGSPVINAEQHDVI